MSQPVRHFEPQTVLQAQGKTTDGIRAVIFDVDGVMTDGSLHYTEHGEAMKTFHVLDGQGFIMLDKVGIKRIVITGRESAALKARLKDLDLDKYAYFGVKNKLEAAQRVLHELGISWEQTAVIGDDWPDIPLFKRAAFSAATAQAHPEAKAQAHYITEAKGGEGAVREFCDLLLIAGAHYDKLYQAYTALE